MGGTFSEAADVLYEKEPSDLLYRSRIDWVVDLCKEKSVVHLGCVDHGVNNLENKRRSGTWLHEHVNGVADRCVGIDLDAKGIAYMRDQLGYVDVLQEDITASPCNLLLQKAPWDILLIAEVLEHIDNPVDFLSRIKKLYQGVIGKILITVPNAFSWHTQQKTRKNIERLNTDHRYWFTPYTICKVAVAAGLSPERVIMCPYITGGRLAKARAWRAVITPLNRASIILVANI